MPHIGGAIGGELSSKAELAVVGGHAATHTQRPKLDQLGNRRAVWGFCCLRAF